jgi:molecular chaperone DnaJ
MAKADYYVVLGLSRDASQEDIKRAYKKLAFQYHPDRNPGDSNSESKFKEINEAYQVLSAPNKRAQYDSFGHISSEGLFTDADFGFNFNDIFGNLFDEVFNTGRRTRAEKGRDLKYDLEISFEDAAFGVEREITIPKRVICDECSGSGAAPGGEISCTACQGSGSVRYSEGFLAISRTCASCRGTGKRIREVCSHCRGDGSLMTKQNVKVKIPAGISDGSRLRIRNEGEVGLYGGPNGDLYIETHIREHPLFKRQGQDIYFEVPISFVQAALGDEIDIPTLEETAKLTVPPGTQSGQVFRLKDKGVPSLNGRGKGDLYVKVDVEVPVKLNSKQKELLKEFSKATQDSHNPKISGFFDKIQEYFK